VVAVEVKKPLPHFLLIHTRFSLFPGKLPCFPPPKILFFPNPTPISAKRHCLKKSGGRIFRDPKNSHFQGRSGLVEAKKVYRIPIPGKFSIFMIQLTLLKVKPNCIFTVITTFFAVKIAVTIFRKNTPRRCCDQRL